MTAPERAGLDISAVVPCFEEVEILSSVVEGLLSALEAEARRWEILLVCAAAAADGTPDLARRLAGEHPGVRCVIQPAGDPGYGRAVALGVAAARHDWVLLMDGDGQLDPRDLPRLVARAPRAGVVVGYRAPRADGWPRRLSGAVYSRVVSALLGLEGVRDLDCAFKLMDRRWLGEAPLASRTGAVNGELLSRAAQRGATVMELPVSHAPRRTGRTRFEMRLGIGAHLPHPVEVWAIARDVASLWARRAMR